jgi:hypothetical protein
MRRLRKQRRRDEPNSPRTNARIDGHRDSDTLAVAFAEPVALHISEIGHVKSAPAA